MRDLTCTLLFLVACTGDPVTSATNPAGTEEPVPGTPTPTLALPPTSDWTWQNPLPYGGALLDVWVDEPTGKAWAVGGNRTLEVWEGGQWTRVGLPLEDELSLPYYEGFEPDYWSIFGWSEDELVIGTSYGPVHWDGLGQATPYPAVDFSSPTPRTLWGPDSNYVIGTWGQSCFFWDGAAWSEVGCSYEVSNYNGVWGTGHDDLFIASHLGELHHYDGTDWVTHTVGPLDELHGVWTADASSRVWVVGEAGVIHAFDRASATFSSFDSGTTEPLRSLWGAADDDIWAVGDHGTLLHWDGTTWSPLNSGVSSTLSSVFGRSADDVWVVGGGGVKLHFDGITWQRFGSGVTGDLTSLHVVDAQTAFAVGADTLLAYDGSTWTERDTPVGEARAVAGTGVSDLWVAGTASIHHYDGTEWSEDSPDELEIWEMDSGGGRLLAIGTWALWEHTPTGWNEVRTYRWPGGSDVHVSPDGVAFALGSAGAEVSASGEAWSALPDIWASVSTIYGTSNEDVWLAGHDGIFRLDNGGWLSHSNAYADAPQLNVSDVWGTGPDDVWAVTDWGNVYHWNGVTWTKDLLWDVGVGTLDGHAGSGVWLAARDGAILHHP